MPAVDLLIFDLDGTLIDSRKDIAHCVNWTLNELGLDSISHDEIYSYVGHGVRALIHGAVGPYQKKYDKALKIFDRYYIEHLLDHTTLMPGMEEVLRHFRDKSMAVITNKPQKYTDPIMVGLKVDEYFGAIFGREACKEVKPHPGPILKVLGELPAAPERTVMIGDTEVDIEAGKGAGVLTCGVSFGFGKVETVREAKPDFMIDEARELIDLFDNK